MAKVFTATISNGKAKLNVKVYDTFRKVAVYQNRLPSGISPLFKKDADGKTIYENGKPKIFGYVAANDDSIWFIQ